MSQIDSLTRFVLIAKGRSVGWLKVEHASADTHPITTQYSIEFYNVV